MRSDMGKVLVERPRIRGWRYKHGPAKGYRKLVNRCMESEDAPKCEGIKFCYGGGTKVFNEHLGPLRRFLDSNVGRPWDKVYSEICQHVDRGNVVQKHILTHLFDYVVTDTVLIDGQPCRPAGSRRALYDGESLKTSQSRFQWYVCPKSGLLRKSRYLPYRRKKLEPPRRVVLNKRQMCLFLGGQWELVTVKPVPGLKEPPGFDVILKERTYSCSTDPDAMRLYGKHVYAIHRRPLSRRELLAFPIPIDWLP